MIRCVAFDYGQVLASPETIFTEPAARLRVRPEAYEAAYWTGRRAYDAHLLFLRDIIAGEVPEDK